MPGRSTTVSAPPAAADEGRLERAARVVREHPYIAAAAGVAALALLGNVWLGRRLRALKREQVESWTHPLTDDERRRVAYLFHKLDVDNDWSLSLSEFVRFSAQRVSAEAHEAVHQAATQIAKAIQKASSEEGEGGDGESKGAEEDGEVDVTAIEEEAEGQIREQAESEAASQFWAYDLDDDGELSLPEFENIFKGIKNMAGDDILEAVLTDYITFVETEFEGESEGEGEGEGKEGKEGEEGEEGKEGESKADEDGGGRLQRMLKLKKTKTGEPKAQSPLTDSAVEAKMASIKRTGNRFERELLKEVVLPEALDVTYADVGASDEAKRALNELVSVPLQRPQLFAKGALKKAVGGILLFGPPGTGKTMLAKACASESGAVFLNISPSSLGSKWHGESEKYARAVFSVARKLAPCVVFMDEIDSMLESRDIMSLSAMRSVQTTLLAEWDGLTTPNERVIVLGATNRPFDLDDAVLRRFPRRLLLDLPDAAARQIILRVHLKDDALAPDVDLDAVATRTQGFSGSDLQHLCREAAYVRVREVTSSASGSGSGSGSASDELRPISSEDWDKALSRVRPSAATEQLMTQLRDWNAQYGDEGTGARSSAVMGMYT